MTCVPTLLTLPVFVHHVESLAFLPSRVFLFCALWQVTPLFSATWRGCRPGAVLADPPKEVPWLFFCRQYLAVQVAGWFSFLTHRCAVHTCKTNRCPRDTHTYLMTASADAKTGRAGNFLLFPTGYARAFWKVSLEGSLCGF